LSYLLPPRRAVVAVVLPSGMLVRLHGPGEDMKIPNALMAQHDSLAQISWVSILPVLVDFGALLLLAVLPPAMTETTAHSTNVSLNPASRIAATCVLREEIVSCTQCLTGHPISVVGAGPVHLYSLADFYLREYYFYHSVLRMGPHMVHVIPSKT
jgi:hypothetical protein